MRGRALALAAFAVLFAGGCWVAKQDWPKYMHLREHGVGANGWVTSKDEGTGRIHYSFMVDEREYSAWDRPGLGTLRFREAAIGDAVVVFYDPRDPAVSGLGDPKERLRRQNGLMGLLIASGFLLVLWWARRELKVASDAHR